MADDDALAGRWLPFLLLPSDPELGRPLPVLLEVHLPEPIGETSATGVEDEVVEATVWQIDAIIKSFAFQAVTWYERALAGDDRVRLASEPELRDWSAQTRKLADRLPWGAPDLAHAMYENADRLEALLAWPTAFFERHAAALDTMRDRDFRVNLNLWAIDRLVREINAVEPLERFHVGLVEFWATLFGEFPARELPFSEFDVVRKRIARLSDAITSGREDALMVDLLSAIMRDGLFGPDGESRKPATPPL